MQETITQTFSAPMGKTTIQTTLLSSLVLLFVGVLQIVLGLRREGAVRLVLLCLGALILLCVPGASLLKVRGYEVTHSHVIVRYGFITRSFPLAQLEHVASQPNALRGSRRDAGNGGLWSFLGWFSNRELGRIRAYVSDLEKTVVLKMPDYTVMVSPENPAAFVQAVRKQKGTVGG